MCAGFCILSVSLESIIRPLSHLCPHEPQPPAQAVGGSGAVEDELMRGPSCPELWGALGVTRGAFTAAAL